MNRIRAVLFYVCLSTITLTACNEGLAPRVEKSGISGTIRYKHWPPQDSLRDLRLVAFKRFPPSNIVGDILQGNAVVYPPIGDTALVPFYVDSLKYTAPLPPGKYEYVVIAQRYGPNIFTDWRPVGQYDLDTNYATPSPVVVLDGTLTRFVDINVDFRNPPPFPFPR
ncbi:MAG: hypothetical protein C4326_06590 [Ignavibacteria bacterium]